MKQKKTKEDNILPTLQWFPGHMKKTRELIEENLKLVDVAIELLDARAPMSSENPLIGEILGQKPRIVVLNKTDLADPKATDKWLSHFKRQGVAAVGVNSMTGSGVDKLEKLAQDLTLEKRQKLSGEMGRPRHPRAMIIGIPNVGKSSLINRLVGGKKTKTADKPGVTRTKQWVQSEGGLELLDTPGILWPKFEDRAVGLKLAFIGAIRDEIYDFEEVTLILLDSLGKNYPERLASRFKLSLPLPDTREALLEAIGKKRGCLLKGGAIDYDKTEHIIIKEFRAGLLGTVTLEEPTPEGDA